MEPVILVLKLSLVTTPTILAIVALVQVSGMKRELGRTTSVLKAAMAEIERLRALLPDAGE
jgi:hypothetical protein